MKQPPCFHGGLRLNKFCLAPVVLVCQGLERGRGKDCDAHAARMNVNMKLSPLNESDRSSCLICPSSGLWPTSAVAQFNSFFNHSQTKEQQTIGHVMTADQPKRRCKSRVCGEDLCGVVIKMDAGGWKTEGRSSETIATVDVPPTAKACEDNEWIKSSISYALSVFRGYIAEKELEEPKGSPKALARILANFYVDIRCKKTGNLFSKNSLSALRFGLKRYYKRIYGIDIISDAIFTEANRKFRAQMALLREKGLENPDPKRAIAPEDMARLYRSDVFNTDRPDSLQNKVFFEIMLFFPHRGRYTLKELKKSDFKTSVDSSGRKQLAILKSGRVEGAIFAQGGPSCPVASFEKYVSHLDPRSELLFQRPRRTPFMDQGKATTVWYDGLAIGVNTLCNKMKVISQLAGLSTIYTNSSITMCKCWTFHERVSISPAC